jgi:uncharacterized repeat protein (TIGR01451 family)
VQSLKIEKSTPATSPTPGATVPYTITITNTGQVPYPSAHIDDDLTNVLDDATYNSDAVASDGNTVSLTGSTLSWSGPLGVGVTVSITYSVTIDTPDNGDAHLDNTVTSPSIGSNCPSGPLAVGDPICTSLLPSPRLEISKVVDTATAKPGDKVTYTVTVENTGGVDFTAGSMATFTDDLTGVLSDAIYNTDEVVTAGPGTATHTVSTVDWAGPLAIGQTATIVYSVTVNSPDAGPHHLRNVITSLSPGSICGPHAPAAACSTDTPISGLHYEKTVGVASTAPGGVVPYTITVTNIGQVDYTLGSPAAFDDDLAGALADADYDGNHSGPGSFSLVGDTLHWEGPLAIGQTVSIGYTLTVKQPLPAVSPHRLDNVLTSPNGDGDCLAAAPRPAACETHTPVASFSVVKMANKMIANPGDTVVYTLTVTNTGNVDYTLASPASLSDDLSAVLPDAVYDGNGAAGAGSVVYDAPELRWSGPLPIAGVLTITYSVTVRDPDLGSHQLVNVVTTTDPGGDCPTGSPNPNCRALVATSGVTITKVVTSPAAPGAVSNVGEVISYEFAVTNVGLVDLTNVVVTDVQTAPAGALTTGPACPATTLAAGATMSCTATYIVTQADLDHGRIDDAASVTGDSPTGTITAGPATARVPVEQHPGITIVKTVTSPAPPSPVSAVGDVITYSFAVANVGNVTLTNVSVVDTQTAPAGPLTTGPDCLVTTLAPAAATTCSATYTVTQADLDKGSIDDSAVAQAAPPIGPAITSAPSSASVPVIQAPGVSTLKVVVSPAPPGTVSNVGDVITYDFAVTNTGNVTLTGLVVSDTQAAPAGPLTTGPDCPTTTLAPGATVTCSGTYAITQADLDHGSVDDVATATATPPGGAAITSPPSSASVTVAQNPKLTIVKSIASPSVPLSAVGEVITYDFAVTNAGNVTITNLVINDAPVAPAGPLSTGPDCPSTTLAPGAQVVCTGTYATTRADFDAGHVDNTATATGTPPSGAAITSDSSSTTIGVAQRAAIGIVKSVVTPAPPAMITSVGEVVTFRFTVTNSGNVTLTNVTINDTQVAPAGPLSAGPTCPQTTLAAGESMACSASYTVTQADLDHGRVDNTATASGTPPSGGAVTSPISAVAVSTATVPDLPSTGIDGSMYVKWALLLISAGFAMIGIVAQERRHRRHLKA